MTTKKSRGAASKPALVHISLRVSAETLAYFKQFASYTNAMREVLEAEMLISDDDCTPKPVEGIGEAIATQYGKVLTGG